MKVGAGGLQSQVTQDVTQVRRVEQGRQYFSDERQSTENSNYQKPVDGAELFKAVEKLNNAAVMFNCPYFFKIREEKKKQKVELTIRGKSTVVKEVPPERVLVLAEEPEQAMGFALDEQI